MRWMSVSGSIVRVISGSAVPHPTLGFGTTLVDFPGVEYSLNVNMISVLLSFGKHNKIFSEACWSLIEIHISTDSFVNTTCFIVCNSILHLQSLCLFSGTSRSIRRSWPTWTTWQKSKSVAINSKMTSVFYSCMFGGPLFWHFIFARVSCFDMKSLGDQSFSQC